MQHTTMSLEKYYEIGDSTLWLCGDSEMDKQYHLQLRDMPKEEKPREKLMRHGPAVLTSPELLAIVLSVGTIKEDVLAMSRRLLKEYGDAVINQRDPAKVSKLLDVPVVKACQLVACFELGRRFFKMPDTKSSVTLRTASQVFAYVKDMRDLPKENLRGLYLDPHYRLLHDELISIGTRTASPANPVDVFRPAIDWDAAAVILVHNHPTGVASPSPADVELTKQIIAAGRILGVPVLDHIVITKDGYQSVPVAY